MNDKVYTGILELESLQELVERWRSQAVYSIVERLTTIDFPLPKVECIEVNRWPKGRIFSPNFELRWEQIGEGYRTILTVTDSQLPVSGFNKSGQELPLSEEVEYYCWHERDSRLGRTLQYRCVPGQGEVKLVVREYRDSYGRLIFWRYVAMKREGALDEPV